MFQKTVKHIVEKMYLHVLCTPVPEEYLDQNVVFFLRNTKGTFLVCVCVWLWVCVHMPGCMCESHSHFPENDFLLI